MSGGPTVLGLSDTVHALNEGRVIKLLLDADHQYTGSITPSGWLLAAGERRSASAAAMVHDEPRFAERMIERALETGARVTSLDRGAASELADVDGVAAHLRW